MSEISRTLKMAAMETGVPFVTLSQMNRSIDMSDREPSLSDISRVGSNRAGLRLCQFPAPARP